MSEMTDELAFLSPHRATPEARWRSPLERALEHAPGTVEDVTAVGKVEVRGDVESLAVDGEVIRITPRRALVLGDADRILAQVGSDLVAVDVSAAWAGVRVQGERLLRRLTDLDLDALPAIGSLHHVQTLVVRDDAESFRLYFPQEYGHSVAEIVLDAVEGLTAGGGEAA